MAFSVTHELRREWAFFLPADHFWGFFVAIYDHFSLATDSPPRGYSVDHADRRIPDEQIKEWLSEAIHGDGYAYGYVKLTYHLRREYQLVINKKKV